ncbi:MAG TPA: hypothetical protein VIY48_07765 [Candidatus Paceibacterota bacterium]
MEINENALLFGSKLHYIITDWQDATDAAREGHHCGITTPLSTLERAYWHRNMLRFVLRVVKETDQ